jgi:hypothetical protein
MDGRRTLTHDKSSLGLWPGELKSRFLYKTVIRTDMRIGDDYFIYFWSIFVIN